MIELIIEKLYLGIVYRDDIAVNHRSMLKVICNPVFRCFGFCIGSEFEQNNFIKYKIMFQKPVFELWKKYDRSGTTIKKVKIFI